MSTAAHRYAQAMAVTERARGRAEEERAWLDLLALLDAPAPAPSVVPEAAVEAAALAARKERAFSAAAAFGVPIDDVPYCAEMIARAALTAALPLLTAAPSATRDEVARSIPVDALATFITGHGGDFETGQWRVELAFPLSEPVSVDSWRQDLIDAITPKEDR